MLIETISTWFGGNGPRQVYECRHCGQTVGSDVEVCPHCGPDTDIVAFDLE